MRITVTTSYRPLALEDIIYTTLALEGISYTALALGIVSLDGPPFDNTDGMFFGNSYFGARYFG